MNKKIALLSLLAGILGGMIGAQFNRTAIAQPGGANPVQIVVNGTAVTPMGNKIEIMTGDSPDGYNIRAVVNGNKVLFTIQPPVVNDPVAIQKKNR